MFGPAPAPIPADSTSRDAGRLGVTADRASAIADAVPALCLPGADLALSTLLSDANFACPALQVDRWTSNSVPTFAYQFNDDTSPQIFAGPDLPPIATHSSEIQYLFDQPNAPYATPLNPTQETLAATMRTAWASFAANGNPSTRSLAWPAFEQAEQVMSLVPPQPQNWTGFPDAHHCSFWAAG